MADYFRRLSGVENCNLYYHARFRELIAPGESQSCAEFTSGAHIHNFSN